MPSQIIHAQIKTHMEPLKYVVMPSLSSLDLFGNWRVPFWDDNSVSFAEYIGMWAELRYLRNSTRDVILQDST